MPVPALDQRCLPIRIENNRITETVEVIEQVIPDLASLIVKISTLAPVDDGNSLPADPVDQLPEKRGPSNACGT